MKYVIKNLKSFILAERMIFTVTVICITASAFIINFSHGLYYNYSMKKVEAELDMTEFNPSIAPDTVLTKGELQQYVEALESRTLDSMTVIYASARIDAFPEEESYGGLNMRFVIRNGQYGICEVTRDSYEKHGIITSGRYLTNEEEASGSYSAMMWGMDENDWNEAGERLKNDDGTVTLFGKRYTVVGTYRGGGGTPVVPFLTVPGELRLGQVGFSFERNLTRSAYEDMTEKAELIISGKLSFPELDFPDGDQLAVYDNMMYVSIVLSVISVANFTMLFYFILKKRQRRLAVMRLCGCTKRRAAAMYLYECAVIVMPCYAVGTALEIILTKKVFGRIFEHFAEAYSAGAYLKLFAVYITALAVISAAAVAAAVGKSVTESMRGADR